MIPLVKFGWFRSHSGIALPFKIDCDALSDETIGEIAELIASNFEFGRVDGIPRGGLRLADALLPFAKPGHPLLIVDDVLTTGTSMEKARKAAGAITIGAVIFARGPCPSWVWPLFTANQ